ncbi:MAG: RNA methyltransferase [Actinobacteria bacterium]|nr:RNA methyltransferase [Actinomycetota bacterium]
MIESKDNEKLKLVRKLRERKHREREGLFVTEGEDLLAAGLAAGAKPRFALVAAAPRSSLTRADGGRSSFGPPDGPKDDRGGGVANFDEVAPELLASVSSLGSGTRALAVWDRPTDAPLAAPCVYLDGVGDPGNVGTIVRTAHALLDATVALGPGCADPFGPKATRASMGSLFARPPVSVAGVEATPEPRVALLAHGGDGLAALAGAATLCLGAERDGLRPEVVAACAASATIPLRGGAESLNVAAAAAVACARMSEVHEHA